MPEGCAVCGDPVFLHVNERAFCRDCGWEILVAIESTTDFLRRHRQLTIPSRFATIGEEVILKTKREGR